MNIDSIMDLLRCLSLDGQKKVNKELKTMIHENHENHENILRELSDLNVENMKKDICDYDNDEWECEGYSDYEDGDYEDGEDKDMKKCLTIVYERDGKNPRYCEKHISQKPTELHSALLKRKLDEELQDYSSMTNLIKRFKTMFSVN